MSKKPHPDSKLTVRQCFERHYDKSDLQPRTVKKYHWDLLRWERMTCNPPIGDIDNDLMTKYRADCLAKGYRPETVNSNWANLKAILRLMAPPALGNPRGRSVISTMPYLKPVPMVHSRPRRIPIDDLNRVYLACEYATYPRIGFPPADWWRCLLTVAYFTGLRKGDLLNLRREQFDLEAGEFRFTASKTQKEDVFPLHPVALTHLRMTWLPERDRLFRGMQPVGSRLYKYVFVTIRRVMNLALNLDLILRSPCKRGMAPQAKSTPVNPPNDEQVSALLNAVADSEWEAVFVLACSCGLRQGEIFALSWDDLDFDSRKLWVRHSVEELGGKLRIKEPKSASGRRVVKLPQTVVDVLNDHRKRLMVDGKAASPYLFTDDEGGFLRKSNFQRRVWEPLKAKAGLPDETTFHDLRHAHASLLLRQNVHPKIVQERMGHSSIKLTMDTYSHLMPDAQDVAADAVDRAMATAKVASGCQVAVKPSKTARIG